MAVPDLTALRGLARSLAIYRRRGHLRSLTRFCAEAVPDARLVFDIGAHVGDRTTAFRRNGARVVAVEPQPLLARALRVMFCLDRDVRILQTAVTARADQVILRINRANPTVSTLSDAFTQAADGAPGWEGQEWDDALTLPATTLDRMIAEHGRPDFIKIDTEGHEAEVLAGLTHPVPALAFEITTIAREAGIAALDEARRLGFSRFRFSQGESHRWSGDWMDAAAAADLIRSMPDAVNSGDIYARKG